MGVIVGTRIQWFQRVFTQMWGKLPVMLGALYSCLCSSGTSVALPTVQL